MAGSIARQRVGSARGAQREAKTGAAGPGVVVQRATVLLISDGLEHGDVAALGFETERLAKSCRQLVWLNPLLRFEGFEAKAAGRPRRK